MRTTSVRLAGATLIMFVAFGASAAQAQIEGQTLGGQFVFPTRTTVAEDLGSKMVGPGPEFRFELTSDSNALLGALSFDFSNGSLVVRNVGGTVPFVAVGPGEFNGFRFSGASGTLPPFTSFVMASGTTVSGFDNSRLSFDANSLFINFQGLTVGQGQQVVLSFTNAQPSTVPEPTSVALVASGLVGLLPARRYARRRQ